VMAIWLVTTDANSPSETVVVSSRSAVLPRAVV